MKLPKVSEDCSSLQQDGMNAGRTCVSVRFLEKEVCDCQDSKLSSDCLVYENVNAVFDDTVGKYPIKQRLTIVLKGEPLLYQEFLSDFIRLCALNGTENIVIETKGDIEPNATLNGCLQETLCHVTFLIGLHVEEEASFNLPVLRRYLEYVKHYEYIDVQFQFFVKSDNLDKVLETRDAILEGRNGDYQYFKRLLTPRVLLTPLKQSEKIATFCVEHGFTYAPRLTVTDGRIENE